MWDILNIIFSRQLIKDGKQNNEKASRDMWSYVYIAVVKLFDINI